MLGPTLRWIYAKLRPVLAIVSMGGKNSILTSKKSKEEPPPQPAPENKGSGHGGQSQEELELGSKREPGVSSARGFGTSSCEDKQEVVDEADEDIDKFRADPSDEFYCGYDSTWESDDDSTWEFEGPSKPKKKCTGRKHVSQTRKCCPSTLDRYKR